MSKWTQNGSASITPFPNGNIRIIIVGTVKSNAVIESIGLNFSSTYELSMTYNSNNGIIISTSCIKIN
jgi:hypothetical protein